MCKSFNIHNVQKGFLNRLKGPKYPNMFQSHPKYCKCLNKSDKKPNVLEGVKYAIFPSKISEINRIMFRKVKKTHSSKRSPKNWKFKNKHENRSKKVLNLKNYCKHSRNVQMGP